MVRPHALAWPAGMLVLIGSAAAAQPRAASGSYVGDGQDNRAIGVGFTPQFLLIQGTDGRVPVGRSATMPEDSAKAVAGLADALTAGRVRSLGDAGFVLGPDGLVNLAGTTYHWVAFGGVATGTYLGDLSASRVISAVGFTPVAVFIMPEAPFNSTFRFSSMPGGGFDFGGGGAEATGLMSFEPGGFRLGSHGSVNGNGVRYHFIAWPGAPGLTAAGSYAGNGVDGRSVGGLGFAPEYVLVRRETVNVAVHRPRSIGASTDLTLMFNVNPAEPDHIKALQPDGFQLGTSGRVNASTGDSYFWMAVGAGPDGGTADGGTADGGLRPVAVIEPASLEAAPGDVVTLDGRQSRPTPGAVLVAFRWSQPEGPSGVALGDSSQAAFTAREPGDYVFRLVVADSTGAESEAATGRLSVSGDVYQPPSALRGCGCGAASGASFALLAFLGFARRRRRGA